MKALVRNMGETVLESYAIPCINWNTGAPLTNHDWYGGPYILVNDYVPGVEDDFAEEPEPTPAAAQDPAADVQDTIVIDGVTYTRTS